MDISDRRDRLGRRSEKKSSRFYRPELDSLRFFAFFGVFAFHVLPHERTFYVARHFPSFAATMASGLAQSGAFGVDLFFALSSFLITCLLLREKETSGRLEIGAFYVRRILRIWPLYFLFIAIALLISLFVKGQELKWPYVTGYLLMAGNWICAVKGLPASVASPLWSISVEEQFYVVWPQVVRTMTKTHIRNVAAALLFLGFGVRLLLIVRGATGGAVEYNSFARIDAIAWGVLLACAIGDTPPRIPAWLRALMVCAGVIIWGVIAYSWPLNRPYELAPIAGTLIGRPLVAMASCLILWGFVGAGYRILTNAWLVYLGKISYGLYVFHILGLLIAHLVFPAAARKVGAPSLGLLITVMFSVASYQWFEFPFLRLKERFAVVPSRPA